MVASLASIWKTLAQVWTDCKPHRPTRASSQAFSPHRPARPAAATRSHSWRIRRTRVYVAVLHREAVTLKGVAPVKLDVSSDADSGEERRRRDHRRALRRELDERPALRLMARRNRPMSASQRPSHRACAAGCHARRAACRIHRNRPCSQLLCTKEFSQGKRPHDA